MYVSEWAWQNESVVQTDSPPLSPGHSPCRWSASNTGRIRAESRCKTLSPLTTHTDASLVVKDAIQYALDYILDLSMTITILHNILESNFTVLYTSCLAQCFAVRDTQAGGLVLWLVYALAFRLFP